MRYVLPFLILLVTTGAWSLTAAGPDDIVNQIENLKKPVLDHSKASDPKEEQRYESELAEYNVHKNQLIWTLYKEAPKDPRVGDMLISRWLNYDVSSSRTDKETRLKNARAEIAQVLKHHPTEAIKEAAAYSLFTLKKDSGEASPAEILKDAERFADTYPKSHNAPVALFAASIALPEDQKADVYRKLVDRYPDFPMVPFLKGAIHRHDAVNKPMALTFTDAVTGAPVDISTMKGKVIMLDFWATWCGPCIAELPTVKKLYETYHDKGLEVIGISLDVPEAQGGLTKLKDFVAKNSMPWPEYFEGKQFGGDFSGAYGIMSIPAQFLIDKNGMFVGMADVRSAEFEAELQKLLNASS